MTVEFFVSIQKLVNAQLGHHASRENCQCDPCRWAREVSMGLQRLEIDAPVQADNIEAERPSVRQPHPNLEAQKS